MSAVLAQRHEALPSVEKACALLAKARTTREVKEIRALAQAVATLERGKETAVEAAEIILHADARIGELTREIPKAPNEGGPRRKSSSVKKHDSLAEEGLTRKRAAECEKIAEFSKSGDLDRYTKACRATGVQPTTSGALTLAKLPAPAREKVFASVGDKEDVRKAIAEVKKSLRAADGVSSTLASNMRAPDRAPVVVVPDGNMLAPPPPNSSAVALVSPSVGWDAEDFLVEVRDQLRDWRTEWRKHEPKAARLVRALRMAADLFEREEQDDA